jgi:hypothetical protein
MHRLRGRRWLGCFARLALCVCPPVGLARADDADVPAHNRADLREAPARPPIDDRQDQARLLFDAIVHDDPSRAAEFFFPRAAFLQVKAMAHPETYYARLRERFDQDVHALHVATPDLDRARFERLELGTRGGWMAVGDEGNRLPYWAARHASLYYRVGNQLRRIEVRVLITWDDRWYVIHLSEFH